VGETAAEGGVFVKGAGLYPELDGGNGGAVVGFDEEGEPVGQRAADDLLGGERREEF